MSKATKITVNITLLTQKTLDKAASGRTLSEKLRVDTTALRLVEQGQDVAKVGHRFESCTMVGRLLCKEAPIRQRN